MLASQRSPLGCRRAGPSAPNALGHSGLTFLGHTLPRPRTLNSQATEKCTQLILGKLVRFESIRECPRSRIPGPKILDAIRRANHYLKAFGGRDGLNLLGLVMKSLRRGITDFVGLIPSRFDRVVQPV